MRITFGRGGGARRVKNPRPIHTSPEPPAAPQSSGTGAVWYDERGYRLPAYSRVIVGDCCKGCGDTWECP